jgi:enoyl-[acyl-carrier protein] reductase II
MAAAFSLGAEAVQIGSLFVASPESSAHQNFKNLIVNSSEGATELSLKQLTPVRLLKNKFYEDIKEAQQKNASNEELKELLGRGRAKKGMFEGDLTEGELEIGQIASAITTIKPAATIVNDVWAEFNKTIQKLQSSF